MIGDYVTKPVNGTLFKWYRGIIMGHISILDLANHPLKEHVGNDKLI